MQAAFLSIYVLSIVENIPISRTALPAQADWNIFDGPQICGMEPAYQPKLWPFHPRNDIAVAISISPKPLKRVLVTVE